METALNITTERLNSANIAVKTTGAPDYELRANVNVTGTAVSNIDGGQVTRLSDNTTVASFNTMGGGMPPSAPGGPNLTITYLVTDIALQCEINERVDGFIAAVRAKTFTLPDLSF